MGRFKVKKQSTFIDMTAMSDVTVLLLTFFMLTSQFVKPEPIKVNAPQSVSDIKIPETNLVTVVIEPTGRVVMGTSTPQEMKAILEGMNSKYDLGLSANEVIQLAQDPMIGVPLSQIKAYAKNDKDERDKLLQQASNRGILCDSTNNEFKEWMKVMREAHPDMRIAIKADAATPYATIKHVMNSLQDLQENRYNLITALKGEEPVE